ncbi:MAG: low-specificity L-threonine aldolase [Anaerolinea sp.]|nr:low-specificity L-threonine aldolase [Anaerolinea sp.]
MQTIDLRSDTVSHPTPEMRRVMAEAAVGDDVYGEDPTVIEIQDYAAELLGKEAALYLPTATMANTAAVLTHCARGDELIVSKRAHIFLYEQGAAAQLGGVNMNPLEVQFEGTFVLEEVEKAIRADDPHFPRTSLICLENTVHGRGGTPITPEYTAQVGALAKKHGLKVHLDGARLFNAAAALKVDPKVLAAPADSIQLCLSKGLCAPVGALLVGTKEFIARALRTRKVLGGGMRQAGVIAAAGLLALREMRSRLHEDHHTAAILAQGLADIPGIVVEPAFIRTNMVFFSLPKTINGAAFVSAMQDKNIILRSGAPYFRHFRIVTHYWITPERAHYVVETMREYIMRHQGETAPASTH